MIYVETAETVFLTVKTHYEEKTTIKDNSKDFKEGCKLNCIDMHDSKFVYMSTGDVH